mgnify:CR=1 FL=1
MDSELKQWLPRPPQQQALSRKLGIAAWILSAAILLLVVIMQKVRLPLPEGWSTAALPAFHAGVNLLAVVVLVLALIFIKLGKVKLHRAMMVGAMILSVLFLLSYVAYHMTNDPTRYGGVGAMRTVYFLLLVSHIVCAAVRVTTMPRASCGSFDFARMPRAASRSISRLMLGWLSRRCCPRSRMRRLRDGHFDRLRSTSYSLSEISPVGNSLCN